MSVVKELVSQIIDYAGLFPPAQLPLEDVVSNYEQYLSSELRWMLARLVLPIGKIDELENLRSFQQSENLWKISALVPPINNSSAFESAMDRIAQFNRDHASGPKAVIDNIEIKTSCDTVTETAKAIPESLQAYLEIPHVDDPSAQIRSIADCGRPNIFAKIRTGGITEDLIPSPFEVARFISSCARHDVGMKATAGLHHPVRGEFRLTYEDAPDFGVMFGYLNVFIAGCFAFSGNSEVEFLEKVLSTTSIDQFELTESGIRFADVTVSKEQIDKIRQTKLTTFGSCSFTEPTDELAEHGWLDNVVTN